MAKTYDELLELVLEVGDKIEFQRHESWLDRRSMYKGMYRAQKYGMNSEEQRIAGEYERRKKDDIVSNLVKAAAVAEIILFGNEAVKAIRKHLKKRSDIEPEKKSEYNDMLDELGNKITDIKNKQKSGEIGDKDAKRQLAVIQKKIQILDKKVDIQ